MIEFKVGDIVFVRPHPDGYELDGLGVDQKIEYHIVNIEGKKYSLGRTGNTYSDFYIFKENLHLVKKDIFSPVKLTDIMSDVHTQFLDGYLYDERYLEEYSYLLKPYKGYEDIREVYDIFKPIKISGFHSNETKYIKELCLKYNIPKLTIVSESTNILTAIGKRIFTKNNYLGTYIKSLNKLLVMPRLGGSNIEIIIMRTASLINNPAEDTDNSIVLMELWKEDRERKSTELRHTINSSKERIRIKSRELLQLSKDMALAESQIITTTRDTEYVVSNKITSLDVLNSTIYFTTIPLSIKVDGLKVELGEYSCSINVTDNHVQMMNLTRQEEGYWGDRCHAPHVDQNGIPCLGGFTDVLIKLLMAEEYDAAIATVIGFIETVVPEDSAGQQWWKWIEDEDTRMEYQEENDENYSTCEYCDAREHNDDIMWVHDTCICSNCYQEKAFYCEDCGNDTMNEDGTSIEETDMTVCNGCYDDHYAMCDECNENYHTDHVTETETGDIVCNRCLDENYFECDDCYTFHHIDKKNTVDDKVLCDECVKRNAITPEILESIVTPYVDTEEI